MAFLPKIHADLLADIVHYHDAICRNDLANGNISSERDYVSALCTHLQYPEGSFKSRNIAKSILAKPKYTVAFESVTLPPYYEKKLGCDGIIVLSSVPDDDTSVRHKIGLFEAKWPRLFGGLKFSTSKTSNIISNKLKIPAPKQELYPPWDSFNSADESHFSTQLIRQSKYGGSGAVMWEQFFSEEPVGHSSVSYFSNFGSTCVMHRDALHHMRATPRVDHTNSTVKNGVWGRKDLRTMLKSVPHFSLRDVIYKMAICEEGDLFSSENGHVSLPMRPTPVFKSDQATPAQIIDDSNPLSIPILGELDNKEVVLQFMYENGLRSYTHIDFDVSMLRRQKLKRILREFRRYDLRGINTN